MMNEGLLDETSSLKHYAGNLRVFLANSGFTDIVLMKIMILELFVVIQFRAVQKSVQISKKRLKLRGIGRKRFDIATLLFLFEYKAKHGQRTTIYRQWS